MLEVLSKEELLHGLKQIKEKGWIENYKTELITLSYDYYRMLKSLNDIKNNDIGSNGLSFMFSTYTNVQGGYGCVAGYSMEETSWIK